MLLIDASLLSAIHQGLVVAAFLRETDPQDFVANLIARMADVRLEDWGSGDLSLDQITRLQNAKLIIEYSELYFGSNALASKRAIQSEIRKFCGRRGAIDLLLIEDPALRW